MTQSITARTVYAYYTTGFDREIFRQIQSSSQKLDYEHHVYLQQTVSDVTNSTQMNYHIRT